MPALDSRLARTSDCLRPFLVSGRFRSSPFHLLRSPAAACRIKWMVPVWAKAL